MREIVSLVREPERCLRRAIGRVSPLRVPLARPNRCSESNAEDGATFPSRAGAGMLRATGSRCIQDARTILEDGGKLARFVCRYMMSHRATDSSSQFLIRSSTSNRAWRLRSKARSRKNHADSTIGSSMFDQSIKENNETYFHFESQVRAMAERFGYSTSDKSFLVSIGEADSCSDI